MPLPDPQRPLPDPRVPVVETRRCVVCDERIVPGELYALGLLGPEHARHRPAIPAPTTTHRAPAVGASDPSDQ